MEQIPLTIDSEDTVYTVSDLNSEVKWLLDNQFGSVWVEGEISNLMRARTGHLYFSLKDSRSQLRCAMFRNDNRRVQFEPTNGQKILCRGRLGIYEQRGDYQMVVDRMTEIGVGALQQQFEATKKRLHAEGLFDESHKKPLPPFPKSIGLVTSPTGAALQDALNVLRRRYRCAELIVYPVTVQGKTAAPSIVKMLSIANQRAECDVLILMRGGGSLEDLWAFNEESVARAVYASELPIICGVGHEVDYSIADMVADVRAPTPSAAAELVSPDQAKLQIALNNVQQRLARAVIQTGVENSNYLQKLSRRLANHHPSQRLRQRAQRCDELDMRLQRAAQMSVNRASSSINQLQHRLRNVSPQREVARRFDRLMQLTSQLQNTFKGQFTAAKVRLAGDIRALETISPLNTLARGYAIVQTSDGEVITSATQVKKDQQIEVRVASGEIGAKVNRIGKPPA